MKERLPSVAAIVSMLCRGKLPTRLATHGQELKRFAANDVAARLANQPPEKAQDRFDPL